MLLLQVHLFLQLLLHVPQLLLVFVLLCHVPLNGISQLLLPATSNPASFNHQNTTCCAAVLPLIVPPTPLLHPPM